MAIFMAIGAWLNHHCSAEHLSKVYGVAVLIIAIRGLFFNKEDKLLPDWILYYILAIAGLIQGMFVSGRFFPGHLRLAEDSGQGSIPGNHHYDLGVPKRRLCPLWHSRRLPWWRWLAYVGSVHPFAYSFHLVGRSYPETHQPRTVREVHLRLAYRNWLRALIK